MQILHTVAELRAALAGRPSVGFVPTMGNLHEGHLALVRAARAQTDTVVASIFVNPLQFAPTDDFASYPRTLARDCALLEERGCDVVFAPGEREMYPQPQTYLVSPAPALAGTLEGAVRPGFFAGVCTVVLKLFHLVGPNRAYFGRKDYQQLLVVTQMVREFGLPIEIVPIDTVREPGGLAMSSRNAFLTPAERLEATRLYGTLEALAAAAHAGRCDWPGLEQEARARLAAHAAWAPDYVAVRRRRDLGEPTPGEPLVVLGAARLGHTRLIDNLEF